MASQTYSSKSLERNRTVQSSKFVLLFGPDAKSGETVTNAEQLMTLALRVVAVIIGVYACVDLSQMVFFVTGYLTGMHISASDTSGTVVALWSVPMIVALLLWWMAPRLAHLACGRRDPKVDMSGLDVGRLTHGAFVVVGVWILVFGVIDLASMGFNALWVATEPKVTSGPFQWPYFAANVLRCLFGAGLIVGARNLSTFLLRLRTAGTESRSSS